MTHTYFLGRDKRSEEVNYDYFPDGAYDDVDDVYNSDVDPMETSTTQQARKIIGNVEVDTHNVVLNLARYVKEEIYKKGGNCRFTGHRMVSIQYDS